MSATPLEARSDVTSLIADDAVSYQDSSQHDHTPAGTRHGQPRRRGWFLRRSLVAGDAIAFLIAALGIGALNNGAHTLSHPPLIFGGLFALYFMLRIDVKLTLLALIPTIFLPILTIRMGRAIHDRFEAVQEHFSTLTLSVANVPEDELGQAYEYLIKKFADDSGHTAAEFYTNRTLVHLMTLMLNPQPGESIYDPTCGSGGMLLSAAMRLKQEGKEYRTLKLY